MHAPHILSACAALGAAIVLSCGSEVTEERAEGGAAGTGGAGATASTGGHDPVAGAGGAAGGSGGAGASGGAAGAAPSCHVNHCKGDLYPCGDCADNDGDGLVDMADPECTGPCDNTEESFYVWIECNGGPCDRDCYFDRDCGAGDDDCLWNHECDPLEVPPGYFPNPCHGATCAYDPNANVKGTNLSCAEVSAEQSQECLDFCGPLTPNGCDCFGCCQYPPGSSSYFFLGSAGADCMTTCTLDKLGDPTVCHPCTPVPGCLNACDTCELCLAKTALPPSCGGQQQCQPGAQPCGLDGQFPCPEGYFCLTGCCAEAP